MAQWDDDVTPPEEADYVDIGNCIQFNIVPKVTKKIHMDHRGGVETIDKRVKVKEECQIKFVLDEFATSNLQMYFHGTLSGTDILPMEAATCTYAMKFVDDLVSGTERTWEFWKVEISPAGALDKINHGSGDNDWAKMEFEGEVLSDITNHATQKWGDIRITPTA